MLETFYDEDKTFVGGGEEGINMEHTDEKAP
jgi:hypothetical protein